MSDTKIIDKLRRQQSAIAHFGSFALHEKDLKKILNEAVRICAEGLGTRFAKICRYRPIENDLLIEVGYGWNPGLIGKILSRADTSSPQGRAFTTGEPAICEDINQEKSFILPNFYKEHGIVSTIDILIPGEEHSYGVLEVDSDQYLIFDQQDIVYLTGFANILAEAISASSQRNKEIEFIRNEEKLKKKAIEIELIADTAKKLAKAQNSFIGVMSHELRTPLNAIVGFSHLLAKTPLNSEQNSFLAILQSNTEHLRSLVNDVLDYARIEAGKIDLILSPFSIREFIHEIVMTTKILITDRNIAVIEDVDNNLENIYIGDVTRIRQVMLNIIGNAAKFTKEGSITIRSKIIRKEGEVHTVRFEVEDTGIGIDPLQHKQIFELYERGDFSNNEKQMGTGIGLAVCSAIVRLMDGKLGVISEGNSGSLFWFEIPLKEPSRLSPDFLIDQERRSKKIENLETHRKLEILIAEDAEASRMLLEIILQDLGHNVSSCKNGAEAVAIASQKRFDLIILDLQMPIMGGFQAARIIRSLNNSVGSKNIIALTASSSPENNKEAFEAGIDLVINKPFDHDSLKEILSSI